MSCYTYTVHILGFKMFSIFGFVLLFISVFVASFCFSVLIYHFQRMVKPLQVKSTRKNVMNNKHALHASCDFSYSLAIIHILRRIHFTVGLIIQFFKFLLMPYQERGA